jgi:hypothetical protein
MCAPLGVERFDVAVLEIHLAGQLFDLTQ